MTDKSVEELQIKIAFLEDAVTKLSDEYYRQQRELDDLKSKYSGIVDKIMEQGGDDSAITDHGHEKPPHY